MIVFCFVIKVRDEKYLLAFGKHLQKVRKLKNLTQEDLSFEAGITLSQIARIETGRLNTTISTVKTIAKALNVQPKELLNFEV